MGSLITEVLQGLLVPDLRIGADTYSATLSSVSPAGSRPGRAVADDDLAVFAPLVEGHQGDDLVVVAVDAEAFAYRLGTDSSGDERGWDTPSLMTGAGPLAYSSSQNRQYHDCVTLQDGTVLSAYSAGSSITFLIFDPSDRSVSSVSATTPSLSSTDHVALAMGPAGRVFCFIGDQVWTSDVGDDYATWTLRSRLPYGSTAAAPTGPRSVAWGPGGWVMVAWDGTDYEQWASRDGVRWSQVDSGSSVGSEWRVVALSDGTFVVANIEDTSTDVETRRIESGWSKLSEADVVDVATSATHHAIGLARYPDDSLYIYRTIGATGILQVAKSTDRGSTWDAFDEGAWHYGSAQVYWKNLRMDVVHGLVYLQAQHQGNSNPTTGLWWATWGGWSQVSVGPLGSELQRQAFGNSSVYAWNSWELPSTSGVWTGTTVGTPTESITNGYDRIATNSSSQRYYTITGLGGSTSLDAHFMIPNYDGPGSPSSNNGAFVRLNCGDGVSEYDVEIRIADSGYVVYDLHAATTLASVSVTTTGGLEWRFWIDDGAVSVRHRTPGSSTWTTGCDAQTANSTGGPASSSQLQWGCRRNCVVCDWAWFQGGQLDDDRYFTGTTSLGRELPTAGSGVGIPDASTSTGVARLACRGGAGVMGQTWTLDRAFDYPVEAVYPQVSPSPARRLRTTDKTEVKLVWDLGDSSVASTVLGRAIGMYLDTNGTFRTAYLEYSSNGSSWTTLLTWDGAEGWSGLAFTAAGDIVAPTTSGTAGDFFLQRRALVDGYVLWSGGQARTVVDHDTGIWSSASAATTIKPRLRVEGIDGTESGSTVTLVWPKGWVVGHPTSTPTAARYWRLRIPASQAGPTDYYEIGALVIGEVIPFGIQTAWGWSEQTAPAYRERRSRRGSTIRRQTGPILRTWTLPWDPHEWWVDTSDPDYLASSESTPIPLTAAGDVYPSLVGVLDRLQAAAVPLVALRHIPDTDDLTVVNPDLFLYGHQLGELRSDQVVGDDDTAGQQLRRSAALSVRESA